MKNHTYEFDEIVIGGTLDAAIYSYVNSVPLFFIKPEPPFKLELYSDGTPKAEAYKKLMFSLSLSGYNMTSNNLSSIRIVDNMARLTTGNSALIKVLFKRATVLSEMGLSNIEPPESNCEAKFKVFDWFSVRKGMTHGHDKISTESCFVENIHFYPSERIDGRHDKKDLVAVSTMTQEQLLDIDYSEIYVKFKVIDLMETAGIKGPKNGACPTTGKQKYHSILIEHERRDSSRLSRPRRKNTKFLTYDYTNYQDDDDLWIQISKNLPHFI